MKKQSNLSRLLEIAGSHKYLTYASWVLSAISAMIALVPFYYIWKMIREVLEVAPNFGQAQSLTGNGWNPYLCTFKYSVCYNSRIQIFMYQRYDSAIFYGS